MGWGGRSRAPPLRVRRGVGVTETSVERAVRAISRANAPFSRKNGDIRTLA